LTHTPHLRVGAERLMTPHRNIKLLAVTLGPEGCYFRTGLGFEGRVVGYRVDVVDTTGAGDGFVAGMLAGLLDLTTSADEIENLDEADLLGVFQFANAVAALTTTKPGAITALPSRPEVEAMLAS